MNDTSPEVETRYRTLLMERSGTERLRMACEMFDCAREMMIAGIKAEQPGVTDTELRVAIFLRTYGTDFTPDERDRIVTRLRAWTPR
jgi:hypothetical protein